MQLSEISSASNAQIRRAAALLARSKARREEQAFVIEGLRLFMDTPQNLIEAVFVDRSAAAQMDRDGGRLAKRLEALAAQGAALYQIPDGLMAKVSDTAAPQGILAIVRRPQWTFADLLGGGMRMAGVPDNSAVRAVEMAGRRADAEITSASGQPESEMNDGGAAHRNPLLLILENVQDPGNLGTMFRTAEAAGVSGILMNRGTVDVTNPKTVRATMSAIFRVPFLVEESTDFAGALARLKAEGVRLYAAHLDGTAAYDRCSYIEGSGFLIGNEGNGLTPETAALADELVKIPMCGQIESLNAAMAAGILLFEAARQRRQI